ncbi:unnamed protein product [Ambrosiozyma monospora]|uniref:Unnamed protein product n=1 Tax=Ambrosiozyma monospora TaxID=43982 RepID=A0ACB5U9M9_AMBMO|nr:unnamed protein product [Ambrosiozyma monospora]
MNSAWSPLPAFLVGRVIKPFTPHNIPEIQKKKQLASNFRNIYPGDLIYLFEVNEQNNTRKWARGYLVSQPNPSDFSSATVNLDTLPESRVAVSIVPMSHIHVLKEMEISTSEVDELQNNNNNIIMDDDFMFGPNGSDTMSDQYSLTSSTFSSQSRKPRDQLCQTITMP